MAKQTSTSVHEALRLMFAPPEYAYLEEVRNGTGFSKQVTRTADALAMSLWPSRGLELYGIEIKTARHDWIREKNNPEKAEEIARYCDRWFLAVGDEKVVQDVSEVPAAWGLLLFKDGRMKTLREATKRSDPKPIDRSFLGAILRKAAGGCVGHIHVNDVKERFKVELEEARKQGADDRGWEERDIKHDFEELKARVLEFEALSGVTLERYQGGKIGVAVAAVLASNPEAMRAQFENVKYQAKKLNELADQGLEALPQRKAKLIE